LKNKKGASTARTLSDSSRLQLPGPFALVVKVDRVNGPYVVMLSLLHF